MPFLPSTLDMDLENLRISALAVATTAIVSRRFGTLIVSDIIMRAVAVPGPTRSGEASGTTAASRGSSESDLDPSPIMSTARIISRTPPPSMKL